MKFRNKFSARKIYNMIFSKWLVDEELAKNSSLQFELISTIVVSRIFKIGMKMLIKIEILSLRESQFFLFEHWIYD